MGSRTLPHQLCSVSVEAVVGVDDQHGVFPEIVLVHPVQHLAQVVIAHAHHSPVLVDDVLNLLFRLALCPTG
jgi:hypothetical protein